MARVYESMSSRAAKHAGTLTVLPVANRAFAHCRSNYEDRLPRALWHESSLYEPFAEACRSQARIFARREALVIDCRAVIQGFGIGHYRPWVPCCTQELPNQFVLTDQFGTSQVDRLA